MIRVLTKKVTDWYGKYERPDVHIEVDKEADKEKEVDKKSIAVSGKPKQPLLADQDFINSLKANTAYKGIDIDRELSKMDAWLSLPKNKGRKKTDRFILNWLNKIDKPINTKPEARPIFSPVSFLVNKFLSGRYLFFRKPRRDYLQKMFS